jgi:hypothetical protein
MKTLKSIAVKALAIMGLAITSSLPAQAQMSDRGYANIDWQVNIPISNKFAGNTSGWGMNFDGGYFVTDNVGLGLFLSFANNYEYFSLRELPVNDGTVSTDQQHSLFQLPFGATFRYQWTRGNAFQPYVAAKLGAEYANFCSYYNVFEKSQGTWGFYGSPEVGINIFPWSYGLGLHIAVYYSISTNSSKAIFNYDTSSLNNFGFRLGVSF